MPFPQGAVPSSGGDFWPSPHPPGRRQSPPAGIGARRSSAGPVFFLNALRRRAPAPPAWLAPSGAGRIRGLGPLARAAVFVCPQAPGARSARLARRTGGGRLRRLGPLARAAFAQG
jgi:hypothetical protein